MSGPVVLNVEGLCKSFPIERGFFRRRVGEIVAVDDVTFAVRRGETVGIVGESGCGKTTVARCVLRLLDPTGGKIEFHLAEGAVDVAKLQAEDLAPLRRKAQMIFQDPVSSLNPRWRVADIVAEPLVAQGVSRAAARRKAADYLGTVELGPEFASRFPHELSGGQRQRVGIARAMILEPALVVADEAVSALDVSVRAQIINLMLRLQAEAGIAYLFIGHDLSVVKHISDHICVMYLGRVVESGTRQEVFERPSHPYTRALLASALVPDPRLASLGAVLEGEIPSPLRPPAGCHFRTRCPSAQERCAVEVPRLRALDGTQQVRCHFAEDLMQPKHPV
jgi:oligopeptide transport system ATP-binding protein